MNCDPDFFDALMQLNNSAKPLVLRLLEGHPKTDDECLLLAAFALGLLEKRPGKAADPAMLRAAELYPKIRRMLPSSLPRGHRLRRGMRRKAQLACTLAYLRELGYPVPDTEAYRDKLDNYLRRSRQPRKKREHV